MKSQRAKVHFNDNGTPVADHFDDVYFSNDSGIDETSHVFIAGNDLPERWLAHTRPDFIIAETGFGTGLNCLVAMAAFRAFRAAHPQHPLKHLYLLSTEKFPLDKADLSAALTAFPTLGQQAQQLVSQYPLAMHGCHRLHFDDDATTLDLWIGDVHDLLPQWHAAESGLVDAWFLDGFAPSKNPEMWTDALFTQMARLSRVGTTFGTFTAAGIVKRGLRDVGFEVKKRNGFGRKRDMLVGRFDGAYAPLTTPAYTRYHCPRLNADSSVAIVGGGLAAATVAHSLARRGISSTLYCKDATLAQGASGNPQGGFYPQLHSEASLASQLQALGFTYARRYYDSLNSAFDHDWCGVLQLNFASTVTERQRKLVENSIWPDSLITGVSQQQATDIAQVPVPADGLFIPLGGWLSPPQLVNALIADCGEFVSVVTEAEVTQIKEQQQGVTFTINGTSHHADFCVVATGAGSVSVDAMQALPLRPVRGQVEAIPSTSTSNALRTVLCHKGYMTPASAGRQALGSTYSKNDLNCDVREEDTEANLAVHRKAMHELDWITSLQPDGQARAAIRLGLPDHQPASGQLLSAEELNEIYFAQAKGKSLSRMPSPRAGRIFTLTGLGSRGLTTAPLLAEVLVAQLTHTPMPLSEALLQAVSPLRFTIRACVRGDIAPS